MRLWRMEDCDGEGSSGEDNGSEFKSFKGMRVFFNQLIDNRKLVCKNNLMKDNVFVA